MQTVRHIEALTAQHPVALFRCESGSITQYLHHRALLEQNENRNRTYVLTEDTGSGAGIRVTGYYTVSVDVLRYPLDQAVINAPVVNLDYLARDSAYRGQAIGTVLLISVYQLTMKVAYLVGATALHVYATEDGSRLYRRHGFIDSPYGGKFFIKPIRDIERYLVANQLT